MVVYPAGYCINRIFCNVNKTENRIYITNGSINRIFCNVNLLNRVKSLQDGLSINRIFCNVNQNDGLTPDIQIIVLIEYFVM